MRRHRIVLAMLGLVAGLALSALAQEYSKTTTTSDVSPPATSTTHPSSFPAADTAGNSEERAERLEGEKRFHNNCGRCHIAPHKFPPRVMATAIRHMRVRATITDEDMRLILHYMTQ
jgi:mono/diheme cytochrome c family protein